MEVIAFVGPSGSGKSHRAHAVAYDYQADLIIDDGLLIKGSRILAGVSAKEQPTRVGAIKTALFSDPRHAEEVKAQIRALAPSRLLIISTSPEMACKIAEQLELPPPSLFVDITEVATPHEIARAQQIRRQLGKHVIPVPTVEVKSRFKGNFIEPLKTFLRRRSALPGRPKTLWVEQTLVRPTFNLLGHFYISDKVIEQLAAYLVGDGVISHPKVEVGTDNTSGNLTLNIEVAARYGVPWRPYLEAIQLRVKEGLENMTGLTVKAVNITVKHVLL
ncbi:MAG: Asp23/Gls24 family envelope stress response protein [Thermanaeromonas sp.]|uniref:Asp23/Gls24 family envelope stress response protein n=1 Tax=Thermanaeromonas sp. TaxID=2003697 RepID=UPI00243B2E86|nr:Asp23/Gls24 family envelope stress response protein [Thermanaeromonas sp.]MCG0277295.1 Asp23/Gls24 family envelope stress response protein [Thermanaeromonas sp.]